MEHSCISKVLSLCEQPKHSGIDLESFEDALDSPHCPVCRILVHSVAQYQGIAHPLKHSNDGSKLQCRIHFDDRQKDDPGFVDFMDFTKPGAQNVYIGLDPGMDNHLLYRGEESKRYSFFLRPGLRELYPADPSVRVSRRKHSTDDGTVHPGFLVSWIEAFKRNHAKCVPSMKSEILRLHRHFRLIDVKAMKIVPAPDGARYAALSYVWGADCEQFKTTTANHQLLTGEQGLSPFIENIPRTVRDAITLLQRLEWQYLWIDALCIIQDSQNDKMEQISAMHAIYEGAELVLAAAYGSDANAGLPGIEPYRFPLRGVRARESIHERVHLLSGSVHLYDALLGTHWYTRGWTFQESRLATMQLTFTASQTYLSCRCGKISMEQHALDAFHHSGDDCQSVSTALAAYEYHFRWNWHRDMWMEYNGLLREYTRRDLSSPGDILNAFSGILANLERKWGTRFLFGLPESSFAFSLQWIQQDQLRRRDCTIQIRREHLVIDCPAPSWSWAGWIGVVFLPPRTGVYEDEYNDKYNETLEVTWTLSDHNVPLDLGDPIRYTLLQAVAPTAYFDIGGMRRNPIYNDAHLILSSSGKLVGYIKIPSCEYWTAGNNGQPRCEFIALSAGPKLGKEARAFVEIMLVSNRQNGIAFRIGIASISWEDWLDANPVEQFVTLG